MGAFTKSAILVNDAEALRVAGNWQGRGEEGNETLRGIKEIRQKLDRYTAYKRTEGVPSGQD